MAKRKPEAAAVWTPVGDLVPWEDNPRLNDGLPVEKVVASIKRFGFAAPIVARKEDRMVIAGHTRLKAALQLGLDSVPVRFVDLDPADARLLALADNRVGEEASWDIGGLSTILAELDEQQLDLGGLGFDADELNQILGRQVFEEVPPEGFEDFGEEDIETKHECPKCGYAWR